VGVLCASYLGADWIATPVSCNSALELCGRFPNIVRTRIGSPYVIAGMEAASEGSLVAGYEANGGFLLGSNILRDGKTLSALATRDAVLPMVTLLVMAKEQGVPLSELVKQLPARFTHSDRLQEIPTAASQELLARLEQDTDLLKKIVPLDAAIERSDKTDGLRLYFDNGDIVHFRPSGNAPELRCYCESATQEQAQMLCDTSLQNLRAAV
jgi:phosphomannomutase